MTQTETVLAAQTLLEHFGLEPTLKRVLVLAVLQESHTPLNAREIFQAVLQKQTLNRVTVYRILDLLTKKKVINRITAPGPQHFFCVGEHHSHFHCTDCGLIQCIANENLNFDTQIIRESVSTKLSDINLHLEGLCQKCTQKISD